MLNFSTQSRERCTCLLVKLPVRSKPVQLADLMYSAEGEESRFELALSTSLLNELKYGSQLGRLAESILLSAFGNRLIEPALQREIAATLPCVKYIR